MQNQPNSNPMKPPEEAEQKPLAIAGDYNVVYGSVGPAVVVGRGTVRAEHIAGNDINSLNDKAPPEQAKQFAELMVKLKDLIVEAHRSGELPEKVARKTLKSLAETAEIVSKEHKPPKTQIVRRLEYVADVLDMAVDLFSANGGVAKVLLQAMPIVALLIKIASRIF